MPAQKTLLSLRVTPQERQTIKALAAMIGTTLGPLILKALSTTYPDEMRTLRRRNPEPS